jgi:hypothetical protein
LPVLNPPVSPLAELKRGLWVPAGTIDSSMGREAVSTTGIAVTSGTLRVTGNLVVPAGVPVTSISFYGIGAAVTPANWWFCLIRASDLAVLGKTADQTTAAWGASTEKTLPIAGGPVAFATDTAVYAGVLQVAATPATLGAASLPAAVNGIAPALSGNSTAGLTNPASLGANAAAITAAANMLWARLS